MNQLDRKFYLPKTGGHLSRLRPPQAIQKSRKGIPEQGNWTKVQNRLLDMMYGKALRPTDKVLLVVLYDQIFRHSGKNEGQWKGSDIRQYLAASYNQLADATGLSYNGVREACERLQGLHLMWVVELGDGLYRFSFWYEGEGLFAEL